jgi:uncharacterized protein (DUF1499 family)
MLGATGAAALVAGIVLLALAVRRRRQRVALRPTVTSALLCLGIAALVLTLLFVPPAPSPHRFNDVTTNLADPPAFLVGPAAGVAYPEHFVPWHRAAYGDLTSYEMAADHNTAYRAVRDAATSMPGWEILHEDTEGGVLQALARTRLFRFEDDVVIRVRQTQDGARIDVRSRSRFGGGDRGANAARVRTFLSDLQ